MFFTYLRRELRRRMKQAVFAALGLAVGIGLVITVTAASAESGGPFAFRVGGPRAAKRIPKAGTKFNRDTLMSGQLGTLTASSAGSISALHGVAAAGGALVLTDLSVSGTIPSANQSGGTAQSGGSAGSSSSFKTSTFTVIGIVSQPQGGNPPQVYIPLTRAQALAGMKNDVNTIYVSATSASEITTVSNEISGLLPKAAITTSSDLANEVTGSLSNASNLANKLGRW